jgi:hypothetical protein
MTLIVETAPARQDRRECAYNLFRNKERPELFCAVPEDRPIPSLIVAKAWTLESFLRIHDVAPPGFHERAAKAGVRYNGFYLFQATAPISSINSSAYDSVSLLCRG